MHIVINNQVGFTTSDPRRRALTLYCTDVAKMIEAPMLHVNGDDPEAVVFCAQLAWTSASVQQGRGHRPRLLSASHGHNEADEPAATQPLMYQNIRKPQVHARAVRRASWPNGRADRRSGQGHGRHLPQQARRGRGTGRACRSATQDKYAVDWSPYLKVPDRTRSTPACCAPNWTSCLARSN
ncbi:MAG: thiamine pyrophosphate-dependent enzyme [Chiayiivirga sp.]|nr:thiamine pyrophosphate-dependent enzyme [Chiayiivirga sp.]